MFGYTESANTIMMTPTHTYNKYKASVHAAKWAFTQYEKYNNCFAIRSVNEEMQNIYHNIGLSYARLMQLTMAKANSDMDIIDECESLLREKASFFVRVTCFLDLNKKAIIDVLKSEENAINLKRDLDKLENNLNYAHKVVERMQTMLRSSQQLYQATPLQIQLRSA